MNLYTLIFLLLDNVFSKLVLQYVTLPLLYFGIWPLHSEFRCDTSLFIYDFLFIISSAVVSSNSIRHSKKFSFWAQVVYVLIHIVAVSISNSVNNVLNYKVFGLMLLSHSWGCVFFVTNSCFKRNVRDTKNRKNRVWRITCTPSKLFFHVTFMQHEQALFFLGIFLLLIDFKKIIKICKILSPAVVVVHSEWCQVINLQIMQICIYENIHLQNSQN